MRKKFDENKKNSTPKRREIKCRDNSPLPARYQSKHKRYFYILKKQSRLTHRRTENRGQTCLLVGLKVIECVRWSRKPHPRSTLRLRRRLSAVTTAWCKRA